MTSSVVYCSSDDGTMPHHLAAIKHLHVHVNLQCRQTLHTCDIDTAVSISSSQSTNVASGLVMIGDVPS